MMQICLFCIQLFNSGFSLQPNRKRSCMEEAAGMRVASSGMGLLKNLYNFNGDFIWGNSHHPLREVSQSKMALSGRKSHKRFINFFLDGFT